MAFDAGPSELCLHGRSSGEITCSAPSTILKEPLVSSTGSVIGLDSSAGSSELGSFRRSLVPGRGQPEQRSLLTGCAYADFPVHRCKSSGLGCSSGGPFGFWQVAPPSGRSSCQFVGDASGEARSGISPQIRSRPLRDHHDGQLLGHVLHQERRGDAFLFSPVYDESGIRVRADDRSYASCAAHSGSAECFSGCSFEERQGSADGMVFKSSSSSSDPVCVSGSQSRPICHPVEQDTYGVCVPVSGFHGMEGGRSLFRVAPSGSVRVSPVSSDSGNFREDCQVKSVLRPVDCPIVADEEVVHSSSSTPVRQSSFNSVQSGHACPGPVSQASARAGPASSRLAVIKRSLSQSGISGEAASFIIGSHRESSRRTYGVRWDSFSDWCISRSVDPLVPAVNVLADYLVELFQVRNLALNTIIGHKSAISATWRLAGLPNLTLSPLITALVEGFRVRRPTVRESFPPWDLSVVLNYLMGPPFEPLSKASLKFITLKTVFLLALATAARRSELHALSMADGHIMFSQNFTSVSLRLEVGFFTKNQAVDEVRQPLVIPGLQHRVQSDLPDRTLCPVRALARYLEHTKHLRSGRFLPGGKPNKRLFISIQQNRKSDISAPTISRWLQEVIVLALNGTLQSPALMAMARISGHQIRGMAASLASFSGCATRQILDAVYWKNSSTFSSYYLKDLAQQVGNVWSLGPVVAASSVCTKSNSSNM